VNTASQDLPHHLAVLRERLQHPTDYERALHYFLEEFAGDTGFMEQSQFDESPRLLAVLGQVASRALGQPASLEQPRMMRLAGFGFCHGSAAVAGRVLLYIYLEELDTGLLALIPGPEGGVQLARFRLLAGLGGDPAKN
jgi:hypothetical protein